MIILIFCSCKIQNVKHQAHQNFQGKTTVFPKFLLDFSTISRAE